MNDHNVESANASVAKFLRYDVWLEQLHES